jgi:hypothetical protein
VHDENVAVHAVRHAGDTVGIAGTTGVAAALAAAALAGGGVAGAELAVTAAFADAAVVVAWVAPLPAPPAVPEPAVTEWCCTTSAGAVGIFAVVLGAFTLNTGGGGGATALALADGVDCSSVCFFSRLQPHTEMRRTQSNLE